MVAPGIFEIGAVRLDKQDRSIRFPAYLSGSAGRLNHLLVTPTGKKSESLLRTAVPASSIHAAMVLLDVQLPNTKGAQTSAENVGDEVAIELSWSEEGQVHRVLAQDLFLKDQKSKNSRLRWVYTGSSFVNGIFRAEEEGSLVSLAKNPSALVNSSESTPDKRPTWMVNPPALPSTNTQIEVQFKLGPLHPRLASRLNES